VDGEVLAESGLPSPTGRHAADSARPDQSTERRTDGGRHREWDRAAAGRGRGRDRNTDQDDGSGDRNWTAGRGGRHTDRATAHRFDGDENRDHKDRDHENRNHKDRDHENRNHKDRDHENRNHKDRDHEDRDHSDRDHSDHDNDDRVHDGDHSGHARDRDHSDRADFGGRHRADDEAA
jgi:hypothetical protein